jgi:hypothetical protein
MTKDICLKPEVMIASRLRHPNQAKDRIHKKTKQHKAEGFVRS